MCARVVLSVGIQFRFALDQHFLALGTVSMNKIGDLPVSVANNDVDIRPFNEVDEVVDHELEAGNPPSIRHNLVLRLLTYRSQHRVVTEWGHHHSPASRRHFVRAKSDDSC
jgi:hypothetical protein